MKHDVIESLGSLLRAEGFTNIYTMRTDYDVSLSAVKGDTRLVTHISYRVPVPSHARPRDEVPGRQTARPRSGGDGDRERQHHRDAAFAQPPGTDGHLPAGVDAVIDQAPGWQWIVVAWPVILAL